MLLFFVTTVLAVEPPSRELLDDLDRWESGMDAVLAGPPGCWEFTGELRQVATLHQPPDFFSASRSQTFTREAPFTGRLEDGHWMDIVVSEETSSETELELPVIPLMGRTGGGATDGSESEEGARVSLSKDRVEVSHLFASSVSLLHEAVDAWAGRTETSFAQWDGEQEAVLFLREIPVTETDQRPIRVDVRFPEAAPRPDRVDAVWPRVVKVGKWPLRITIRDAQMHLLTHPHGDVSLPRLESLSLVTGFLGFTLGYEQVLTFRSATPCQKTP